MEAEIAVGGEFFEKTVRNHGRTASAAFFSRLEDKNDRAAETARGGKVPGGGQQRRDVAVMPAAVEGAGVHGGMRKSIGFAHRERVHVGAKADAAFAAAVAQDADDPCLADSLVHLDAPAAEFLGDDARRAGFFIGNFRMRMEIAAKGAVFLKVRGNFRKDVHGDVRKEKRRNP